MLREVGSPSFVTVPHILHVLVPLPFTAFLLLELLNICFFLLLLPTLKTLLQFLTQADTFITNMPCQLPPHHSLTTPPTAL